MVEFIVNWAIWVLGKLGYLGIFSLMALESACIPIPSEAILPFGGYLAYQAELNLSLVIIIGTLGGTLGSIFTYFIGAKGGRPLVNKYAEKLKLSKAHMEASDNFFKKYGDKIAFYSRLLPIVRTFISLPAGISKMNFKKFLTYTFIGSLIWSTLLGTAGYIMGEHWEKIRSWLHIADYLVIIGIVGLLFYGIRKRKKNNLSKI